MRPSPARTRLLVFIVSFVLAFAGIRHGGRSPGRPQGAASTGSLAMIGGSLPGIDLAWRPETSLMDRPIPAACAMTYADPIQTARVIEQYEMARLARDTPPPAALQIELSHRLASGRLVVLTDGKTVLSWPFDAPEGGNWGTLSHQVSILSGRHDVEVRILGAQDELLASAALEGAIAPERVALVRADYRPKERPSLRLAWSSSPEAPGDWEAAADTTNSARKGEGHGPTTQD